ncbi:MAG TPA: hypothetical protein VFJ04_00990 [Rhodanobacteraceae bacterium]|nr:hypothetical protein [Rhodanobacteraceae bacterium]
MKIVSMLVACVFALGGAGAAHASSGNGLLAALGAALSGTGDGATTTPASSGSNHADPDDSAHGSLPDSAASTSVPSSDSANGSSAPPVAPKRPPPALGWQSLLPGSIQ